jgi:hypothetical protein
MAGVASLVHATAAALSGEPDTVFITAAFGAIVVANRSTLHSTKGEESWLQRRTPSRTLRIDSGDGVRFRGTLRMPSTARSDSSLVDAPPLGERGFLARRERANLFPRERDLVPFRHRRVERAVLEDGEDRKLVAMRPAPP